MVLLKKRWKSMMKVYKKVYIGGSNYMNISKSMKYIFILSIFISFIFVSNVRVYAENNQDDINEKSSIHYGESESDFESAYADILLFEKSQKLDMPKNIVSYWFEVPEGSVVDDSCYLNLNLTISSTLINERSSISLVINEEILDTKWIKEVDETYSGWWKVSIPSDTLKIGEINELKIITTQRSIEGDCADIDNPSNWVNLNKISYLHIGMSKYAAPYLGNMYSYYYDKLGEKNIIKNDFIIADSNNGDEINGMLKIASAIGQEYPGKDNIIYSVSNNKSNSIENKVYIGTIDKWESNKELLLPDEELKQNEGFLSVYGRTKENPYNKMLISGKDQNGLNKAIDFFSDRNYLSQINDNKLTVTSDIKNEKQTFRFKEDGLYKLKDFGYNTVNLAGAFHQSTNFMITQPNGIQSGKNSYIKIKFRHSEALVSDNSLITVYFNGIAQSSARLSASNADKGELKVNIPEDILKKNVIDVKIDCYNYLGKIDCSKDYYDTAWTVIDENSEIYFEPGEKGIAPDLSDFLLFNKFSSNNKEPIIMKIPENYDNDTLKICALLDTRTGQNSKSSFDWKVYSGKSELTQDDMKNNMIFIGAFEDINIPKKIKDKLNIDPLGDGNLKISDTLAISKETLDNKIILQVIRSPWDFNKKIYVFLYDENIKENLESLVTDRRVLEQLNGQIATIDSYKSVTNFEVNNDQIEERVPLTFERIKYTLENKTKLPIYVLIAGLLLIIISIFAIVKVRNNKSRFKNAKEKMKILNEEDSKNKLTSENKNVNIDEHHKEAEKDDDYNND